MPDESKTIIKKYMNFYTNSEMEFPITYTLQAGFKSIDEAKGAVSFFLDPEKFIYIDVDGEMYAVTMELLERQIVITKGLCYCRGFKKGERERRLYYCELLETRDRISIDDIRIGSSWCATVENDLRELFSVSYTLGERFPNRSRLISDSIILLASVLFDTMVPTFYLNVMDEYFSDPWSSPSRWKLWKDGVTAFNYFNGEKDYDKSIVGGTRESL